MTFCVENETEKELPFDVEEIAGKVMEAVLEQEVTTILEAIRQLYPQIIP